MKFYGFFLTVLLVVGSLFFLTFPLEVLSSSQSEPTGQNVQIQKGGRLVVVWTSGDRDVALKMVFMYTYRKAKHWDDATLVIWGPSAKLASEDPAIQDYLEKMIDSGVTVKACIACAKMYGVEEKLESLGIIVKGMGDELTSYIKEGRHILTF